MLSESWLRVFGAAVIIRPMSEQSLAAFDQWVQRMLGRPVNDALPKAPSALFPANDPPDLLIYFGEASADDVCAVREQLPGASCLLWVGPPGSAPLMDPMNDAAARRGERTIHFAADAASQYEEKTAMLITRLPRRKVRLVVHHSFRQRYPEVCGRLPLCIKRTLSNLSMDAGRGLIFLRSSLLNLGNMTAHSLSALPERPAGSAALVCAAGPSLRTQLEAVRSFQAFGLIVAVGHAVPTLLRAGIRPHVVVEDDAVAGINWSEEFSMDDALLVAATTVDTRVASRFRHIYWCQGSSPMFNDYLQEAGVGPARMTLYKTVSAHAVEAAIRMGCMRIAMVGQDFSLGASGVLHADGKRRVSGAEHLVDVPANDGGTVRATRDLAVLREALEEYLDIIRQAFARAPEQPQVVNCTEGGARIRGTERMTLGAFCSSIKTPAPVTSLELKKAEGSGLINLAYGMVDCAGGYAAATGRVLECVRSLQEETARSMPGSESLEQAEQRLDQALFEEAEWLVQHEGERWLTPLVQHAARLDAETPGLLAEAREGSGRLCYLERHYQVLRDLAEEIRGDLRAVLGDGTQPAALRPDRDASRFVSFRSLALSCIQRNNSELGEWLRGQSDLRPSDRFRFRWKNQMIPGMEVRPLNGGDFVSVAGEWSMVEEARDEVQAFVQSAAFDPARHGIVVVAPCNWVHVLELLGRYPSVRLIIVEPWLDVLNELILHGCFLHRLPSDALLVGADARLGKWEQQFLSALAVWKNENIRPLFFTPCRVADQEDLRALRARLEALAS